QRVGVPGALQRQGAAAHGDHRPARSRHAGIRRRGRSAGRFPSADLRGARRPGGAAAVLEAGRAGRRPMTTSVLREGKTMDPVSNPPPSGPALNPLGRRSFLGWLTYGLGAVAAVAVGLPFVGYLFGARKAPVIWRPLGRVTDFP